MYVRAVVSAMIDRRGGGPIALCPSRFVVNAQRNRQAGARTAGVGSSNRDPSEAGQTKQSSVDSAGRSNDGVVAACGRKGKTECELKLRGVSS